MRRCGDDVQHPQFPQRPRDRKQLGGAALLFAYAIGKVVNGFIADRVNVKKYIMLGLFVSSLINLLVGFHLPALMLAVIWFVNGFAQATGAPCATARAPHQK